MCCSDDKKTGPDDLGYHVILDDDNWVGESRQELDLERQLAMIAIGPESALDQVIISSGQSGRLLVTVDRPAFGPFAPPIRVENSRAFPASTLVASLQLVAWERIPPFGPGPRAPRYLLNQTVSLADGEVTQIFVPGPGAKSASIHFTNNSGATIQIRAKGMKLRTAALTHDPAIWPTRNDDTVWFDLDDGLSVTIPVDLSLDHYDWVQVMAQHAELAPIDLVYSYEVRD